MLLLSGQACFPFHLLWQSWLTSIVPATNSAYTLLSVIAALSSISDAAPLEVDLGYVGVCALRNGTTG